MKSFVVRTVMFSIIVLVVISGIVVLVNYKIDNGSFYKISPDKSILILGHSHTECGYNDSIIHDALNLSSGGECYFYTYFKLKKLLEENSNIKSVFVGYSNNMIEKEMDEWIWGEAYISARYPKYGAFMNLDDIGLLFKKNPKVMLATQPIATKKYISFLVGGNHDIIKEQAWGGYLFLKRDKTDSLIAAQASFPKEPIDTNLAEINLLYLDKIVMCCKSAGIPIYLIRSPLHPSYRGVRNEELFVKTTTSRYSDVSFLDFKNFPLANSEFGDLDHLNYKGAKKYSVFFQDLLDANLLKADNKQLMIDEAIRDYKNQSDSLTQF